MTRCTLGVDIGTSSSKGVLVTHDGRVIASVTREHTVQRPRPGHVEMDAETWWDEFGAITAELLAGNDVRVSAVGVSGMGPCVLLVDDAGRPVRPAILYGIDTRAVEQIQGLTARYGADAISQRCGSVLTTQAAGPKIRWVADEEPDVHARARRFFMPASWLAYRLTGEYVLDVQSASQCTPMFDLEALAWHEPWCDDVAPGLELPRTTRPGDVAGTVTTEAAERTGLPVGIPVITGTIDAWCEAVSVGAQRPGDLMLMYGTTMFLIATVPAPVRTPSLWCTPGAVPDTYILAGGMATSGAVTGWLRDLVGGADWTQLVAEAETSPPGANGLLVLPYFAGERTPILDPDARGVIAGLTLSHTRGDLYRAVLEATAFGVRHNIETMRDAGASIERVVAVGGGTQGGLWTRIVSDVTGLPQHLPATTVGASFGSAYLAARAVGDAGDDIDDRNPVVEVVEPDAKHTARYDELYGLYRRLYETTLDVTHALADLQKPAR